MSSTLPITQMSSEMEEMHSGESGAHLMPELRFAWPSTPSLKQRQ